MSAGRAARAALRTAGLLAGLIPSLFGACAANPPRIARVSAQLMFEYDTVTTEAVEALAVFVVPEDKDGLEDLEYLHVVSDKAELYWSIDSETWTQIKTQEGEWIGSARLAMPANEAFPRGEYRALLHDLSGDSDEQRFVVDATVVSPKEVVFPKATVSGGRISVTSPADWSTILVYSSAGKFVKSFAAQARGLDIETVKRADSTLRAGFSFSVYSYWSRGGAGLLVGPYFVD